MGYARPIQINVDDVLRKKIEDEGTERRRKLGPTVVDILIEYFDRKEKLAKVKRA